MSRLDIRDSLRDDERRRRDEARLNELERQLEGLTHALREHGSRQNRVEEVHKGLEGAIAQLAGRLDTLRADALQANDARQLDVARLRQSLEELAEMLESSTRPLPDLKAQVSDLVNQVRGKFQELTRDEHRFDELQEQLDQIPPQIDRNAQVAYGVREDLGAARAEIAAVREEVQRAADATKLVEQDARRRVGEVITTVEAANARIDALRDELPPLDVQIDRVRHELHQALPRFEVLEDADRALREEVEHAEALHFERHGQALARLAEVREELAEQIHAVERLANTRFAATMARFNDLEEADRHLGHRLTMLAVRLEELHDEDAAIRREVRQLQELRLRLHLEQAQQEIAVVREHFAKVEAARAGRDDDDDA